MGDLLGVTVRDLVAVLKRKQARIPFEIGAFVALETCEALLPGPARIKLDDVRVGDDGSVSVFAPPNSATGAEAARSVVALLAHLLVAAGAGVPPVLVDLVERGPSDGRWDLERLRDELEASLVPLNRQAARRVLSRMLREAGRDHGPAFQDPPPPPDAAIDEELDALMGGADPEEDAGGRRRSIPTPQVLYAPGHGPVRVDDELPGDSRGRGDQIWTDQSDALTAPHRRADDSLATTLDRPIPASAVVLVPPSEPPLAGPPPPVSAPGGSLLGEPPPARPRSETPAPRRAAPAVEDVDAPFVPGQHRRRSEVDLSGLEEVAPRGKSRTLVLALVFLLLSAGLLVAVAMFRPDAIDRILGRETPEQREAARLEEERRREQERIDRDHAGRYGDLVVSVSPPQAQVLLFVGRGPAERGDLPAGVAHEFVVIEDGKSPARAVIAPDATWTNADGALRYELAVQGGRDPVAFEEVDFGATELPDDMGSPGELGTVRIVTNPPGAKVYLLIGFSPTVRVDDLRTDEPIELVVFKEGHVPSRVMVGPSDWRGEPGTKVAEVDVVLVPREPVEEPAPGRRR